MSDIERSEQDWLLTRVGASERGHKRVSIRKEARIADCAMRNVNQGSASFARRLPFDCAQGKHCRCVGKSQD